MNKAFRSFSLLKTHDYLYRIGYGPIDDNQASVEIPETLSPMINLNITPIPRVCRYSGRIPADADDILILTDDEITVA